MTPVYLLLKTSLLLWKCIILIQKENQQAIVDVMKQVERYSQDCAVITGTHDHRNPDTLIINVTKCYSHINIIYILIMVMVMHLYNTFSIWIYSNALYNTLWGTFARLLYGAVHNLF